MAFLLSHPAIEHIKRMQLWSGVNIAGQGVNPGHSWQTICICVFQPLMAAIFNYTFLQHASYLFLRSIFTRKRAGTQMGGPCVLMWWEVMLVLPVCVKKMLQNSWSAASKNFRRYCGGSITAWSLKISISPWRRQNGWAAQQLTPTTAMYLRGKARGILPNSSICKKDWCTLVNKGVCHLSC